MFNIFNKKQTKISELQDKINKLENENNKLKNNYDIINNKFKEYKKICLYNQFYINKNIFSKKFNELIEFNKLILTTHIRLAELDYEQNYYNHLFTTNYQCIILGERMCLESYDEFINLLSKYNFTNLFKITKKNIIIYKLYGLLIRVIKYIEIQIIKCVNYTFNQISISTNNKEDIRPEIIDNEIIYYRINWITNNCKIIYNNYEKRNNININEFTQKQYFIKILTSLNKILIPYLIYNYDDTHSYLGDLKYSAIYKLYNELF